MTFYGRNLLEDDLMRKIQLIVSEPQLYEFGKKNVNCCIFDFSFLSEF